MSASTRRFLTRASLARDITIILTVKVLALIAIKLIWFSNPPNPPSEQVQRTVLGTAVSQPSVEVSDS
jgi:hypothetical protein